MKGEGRNNQEVRKLPIIRILDKWEVGYLLGFAIRLQKFHFLSNMAIIFHLEVPFLSEISRKK